MSWEDVTAFVVALTALVAALVGVIREIRLMRGDIVSAVESHMQQTIDAYQKGANHDHSDR